MMAFPKSRSFLVTCFLSLVIVVCFFNNPRQQERYFTNDLEWDVFSYYMYLPFTFIYDDVEMRHKDVVDSIFKKYNLPGTYYQAYQLDNGNFTPNYTMGFALLWSPFFFVGHTWATLGGYDVDGWSFPYQFSIACGVLIYVLIGLFFLRKVLLTYFSEDITTAVLLLMVLGTNYLHEAFNDYMQPHAQIFTGYAMLLYYTIRWHEVQKKRYIMIAGFVIGIMILARPSEILCILIPLLWNIYDRESLKRKLTLLRTHFSHFILLLVFAFIPYIPQMIYWKHVTGSWIFFSYQHTEGFDFLQPHIWKVLFSFKKSWFIYTPLIIFPIIGLFLLRKYNKSIFLPLLVFFLANFYLLSSWAAWWNGGSFGMRYFVDSYPVMAIGFGYILIDLNKRKRLIRNGAILLMVLFTALNLFQTWQYVKWIIPEDRMTYAYYKRIFLKTKVTDEDRKLMEVKRSYEYTESFDNPQDYNHHTAAFFNFDNVNSASFDESKKDTSRFYSAPSSYLMGPDDEYGPTWKPRYDQVVPPAKDNFLTRLMFKLIKGIQLVGNDEWGPSMKVRYDELVPPNKDHAWLNISLYYYSEEDIKDNDANIVITMPHKDYNLKYRAFSFAGLPYKKGEWNKVELNYMTPFPYSEQDHFLIYIWHRGKHNLWIDDFKVEAYLKK